MPLEQQRDYTPIFSQLELYRINCDDDEIQVIEQLDPLWIAGKKQRKNVGFISKIQLLQHFGSQESSIGKNVENFHLCLISQQNHMKKKTSTQTTCFLFPVFFLQLIQPPFHKISVLFTLQFCICIPTSFLRFSYSCIFSILPSKGQFLGKYLGLHLHIGRLRHEAQRQRKITRLAGTPLNKIRRLALVQSVLSSILTYHVNSCKYYKYFLL